MSIELQRKTNEFNHAFENLKATNEQKLQEIAQKGRHDSLIDQKLNRINEAMDECKSKIRAMEVAQNRPGVIGANRKEDKHHDAFLNYVRKGDDNLLKNLESKSLSVGSDNDGGYLVSPKLVYNLMNEIIEISPMRKIATCDTISTDSMDIIFEEGGVSSAWVGETENRKDSTSPKISKSKIHVHELYAQPKATQKLIDDTEINIERWLIDKLTESFAELENDAFINGDGVAKPKGILGYNGEVEARAFNALDAESILNLYYSLKEPYARNASFLMNRSTAHHIRTLKNVTTGQYIWTPSFTEKEADKLIGLDLHYSNHMPSIGKGTTPIAIADFKRAYKIIDRAGVRILRDPYTEKPFIKFYATKRVGGEVINFNAIKLMKISS